MENSPINKKKQVNDRNCDRDPMIHLVFWIITTKTMYCFSLMTFLFMSSPRILYDILKSTNIIGDSELSLNHVQDCKDFATPGTKFFYSNSRKIIYRGCFTLLKYPQKSWSVRSLLTPLQTMVLGKLGIFPSKPCLLKFPLILNVSTVNKLEIISNVYYSLEAITF